MKRKQRRNYLRLMQWRHDQIILLVSCYFPFVRGCDFHTGYYLLLTLCLFIIICTCSMFIEIDSNMSITSTIFTPPKFNMEPENDGFQKESPFPVVDFQVPC